MDCISAKSNNLTHLGVFQKLALKDDSAVTECLETHGNLVWSLARSFTVTPLDAEAAARAIFSDIWKYAERFDCEKLSETEFIRLVSLRCIFKKFGGLTKRIVDDTAPPDSVLTLKDMRAAA